MYLSALAVPHLQALGLKTTAEPRPNAYIPGEDPVGAPKPFAEYAPFKPALPGSTMRHVRKPKPREIIL